ncbi:hypothetical protein SAMN05444360_11911 [Chryseobacterium carnipullorum]|uniref:hypothetical protein n=1 Tax=Chryseobacterium carnipullorum TaxID=1124835 RepID=UPI00091B75AC|nr:hypothetical protein [Chryseobacterium carnipullorum]SHM84174.1 hypothetical protein SAMN05444360_11911 [Chryseobacterium carnipullorum]
MLKENEMALFVYHYKNIPQTRVVIEQAFSEFKKMNRLQKTRSTDFKGIAFLQKIQEYIIILYRDTKVGKLLPNGYPNII